MKIVLIHTEGRVQTVEVDSAVLLGSCEHCGETTEEEVTASRKYCKPSHRVRACEKRTAERDLGGFPFIA